MKLAIFSRASSPLALGSMLIKVCSLLASEMKLVGSASVSLMEAMRMQSSLKVVNEKLTKR